MPAIDMLGFQANPDASGLVYPLQWQGVGSMSSTWDHMVLAFAPSGSTFNKVSGLFMVPSDYLGSAKVLLDWTATTGATGNCVWRMDYRAVGGNDVESLDQSGVQEAVSIVGPAPSAARRKRSSSITLTSGNFAPGDAVEFFFGMDRSSGSHTMSGTALLCALRFEYAN